MSRRPTFKGMTLQIIVSDIDAGQRFYATFFGRDPDFAAFDDFLEWQAVPGAEAWVQVVRSETAQPLRTRWRLAVDDIHRASAWVEQILEVTPTPVSQLPGVVAFTDFDDPWGNRLGFYQDLEPSGEQPQTSGSVHDDSRYQDFPNC